MSHIFESPTFTPHFYSAPWMDQMYDEYITNLVPSGDDSHNDMPGLKALVELALAPFKLEKASEWAKLAEGNQVRSFIVTPRNVFDHPQGALRYPYLSNLLQEQLNTWVPGSQAKIVSYPQDGRGIDRRIVERTGQITAKGKVLFQYDPEQRKKTVTQEGGGECEVQVSALRLFVGADPAPM